MGNKGISFRNKGDFHETFGFLKASINRAKWEKCWKYGEMGVQALRNATPVDTGLTRDSWNYEVEMGKDQIVITWTNSNVVKDWYNVAVMIQYGHATGGGGYVEGIDYINPALKPVFEKIADELWHDTVEYH